MQPINDPYHGNPLRGFEGRRPALGSLPAPKGQPARTVTAVLHRTNDGGVVVDYNSGAAGRAASAAAASFDTRAAASSAALPALHARPALPAASAPVLHARAAESAFASAYEIQRNEAMRRAAEIARQTADPTIPGNARAAAPRPPRP